MTLEQIYLTVAAGYLQKSMAPLHVAKLLIDCFTLTVSEAVDIVKRVQRSIEASKDTEATQAVEESKNCDVEALCK